MTPEQHLDFLSGHHYHQVYGDGSDGADHIEPIRKALQSHQMESDAGTCPTCGSARCVGRLRYESCDTAHTRAAATAAARLSKAHRPEPMRFVEATYCTVCRTPWPCDVAVVLEPCTKCGSTDRWLHYWGCGRYYGGSHLGMKP